MEKQGNDRNNVLFVEMLERDFTPVCFGYDSPSQEVHDEPA